MVLGMGRGAARRTLFIIGMSGRDAMCRRFDAGRFAFRSSILAGFGASVTPWPLRPVSNRIAGRDSLPSATIRRSADVCRRASAVRPRETKRRLYDDHRAGCL